MDTNLSFAIYCLHDRQLSLIGFVEKNAIGVDNLLASPSTFDCALASCKLSACVQMSVCILKHYAVTHHASVLLYIVCCIYTTLIFNYNWPLFFFFKIYFKEVVWSVIDYHEYERIEVILFSESWRREYLQALLLADYVWLTSVNVSESWTCS